MAVNATDRNRIGRVHIANVGVTIHTRRTFINFILLGLSEQINVEQIVWNRIGFISCDTKTLGGSPRILSVTYWHAGRVEFSVGLQCSLDDWSLSKAIGQIALGKAVSQQKCQKHSKNRPTNKKLGWAIVHVSILE